MIISNFPAGVRAPFSNGLPNFSYTGEYSILDDGSTSGEWKVILTTSGTLTLKHGVSGCAIQIQGGGGGGGSGGKSYSGGDGEDGSTDETTRNLSAGTYTVEIGAAGAKGINEDGGDGGNGGTTTFADLLTAEGGLGGYSYGVNIQTHSGLYELYGQGGEGGTSSDYTGEYTEGYYYIIVTSGSNHYASPDTSSDVLKTLEKDTLYNMGDSYPTEYTDASGNAYWKLDGYTGGYVLASDCSQGPTYGYEVDTRVWHGYDGNPGIVILSGKA